MIGSLSQIHIRIETTIIAMSLFLPRLDSQTKNIQDQILYYCTRVTCCSLSKECDTTSAQKFI